MCAQKAMPPASAPDEAASVPSHEIYDISGGKLRRYNDIALILPAFVIDENETTPCSCFLDYLLR